MIKIHDNDRMNIERLLGTQEIPMRVLREVNLRWSMMTSCGASGPLGPVGVVDALRHLNIGRLVEQQMENVDWRNMKDKEAQAHIGDEWVSCLVVDVFGDGTLQVLTDETMQMLIVPRRLVRAVPEKKLDVSGILRSEARQEKTEAEQIEAAELARALATAEKED